MKSQDWDFENDLCVFFFMETLSNMVPGKLVMDLFFFGLKKVVQDGCLDGYVCSYS